MCNKKDSLGDRMKEYENVSRNYLTRRIPVIIRLDGKAFHTFTRGMVKPFDTVLTQAMQQTMKHLCENIQGCVLGYTQSDEITLVLTDYATIRTDAWFGYNIQKMASIAASMATMEFNREFFSAHERWFNESFDNGRSDMSDFMNLDSLYSSKHYQALFDARVFNVPKEDVMNCLVWRQQDAIRNSIQAVGQAQFSHKQLIGKSCNEILGMLLTEKGINWNDYSTSCKRGTCCVKKLIAFDVRDRGDKVTGSCARNKWVIDTEIPIFHQEPEYINSRVFIGGNS